SITLGPATISLTASQTQQFTATVTGSSNAGVSWSLNPPLGTISATGLYTAPATITSAQTVNLTATSLADGTKTAMAAIPLAIAQLRGGTPVSISLSGPASGATVSGNVTVSATATANAGVAGVQFYADAAPIGAEVTTAPYSVSWNTMSTPAGTHSL